MDDAKMWYITVGGQTQGPFGAEDIINQCQSGGIKWTTMAYAHGVTKTWTPIEKIPQFCDSLAGRLDLPPIPPPPPMMLADVINYNIFGDDMQFVEIELDPEESVIAEAGAMMYMDQDIHMETIFGDGSGKDENEGLWGTVKGAGKRILTGESLFMTLFSHKGGSPKAKVAFAAPYPGKIIVVDLKEIGGTLICQKEAFLCGAKGVSVGIAFQKKIGVALFGGEGFIMQKLEGDGLLFCHAGGTVVSRELAPEQVIKVDTGCIVGYLPSVGFDIESTDIKSAFFGGEGLFLARLTGPGTVWLQSIPFSRFASRIYGAAKQTGGGGHGEGSVLGGVFNLIGGKD